MEAGWRWVAWSQRREHDREAGTCSQRSQQAGTLLAGKRAGAAAQRAAARQGRAPRQGAPSPCPAPNNRRYPAPSTTAVVAPAVLATPLGKPDGHRDVAAGGWAGQGQTAAPVSERGRHPASQGADGAAAARAWHTRCSHPHSPQTQPGLPGSAPAQPHLSVMNTMTAIQGCRLSAMYTEAAAMSKIAGPIENITVDSMVWIEAVPAGGGAQGGGRA